MVFLPIMAARHEPRLNRDVPSHSIASKLGCSKAPSPGSDSITFASTNLGITVSLARQYAEGPEIDRDKLVSIENAFGGSGNDTLIVFSGLEFIRRS